MKKTLIIISAIAAILAIYSFKPQQIEANAIAKKVQGVTTYVNAEPSRPYKVVLRFKSNMIVWASCPGTNQIINEVVKDGIKQAEKKNIDFDAVIITDSEKDMLIKYE